MFAYQALRGVVVCPAGGKIVMCGIPGLEIGARGDAWMSPEHLDETLDVLGQHDVTFFVYLARDIEGPPGMRLLLKDRLKQRGIGFLAIPIDDFGAPGAAWMRAWDRVADALEEVLNDGHAVGLCCAYGAGRSGMVATHILNRRGASVENALARVRAEFPEAVESSAQEAWLHTAGRAGKSPIGWGGRSD